MRAYDPLVGAATQLQRLAELVLGAAALCEDNAEYVRTIMEMEPEQQRSLVPIIEQVMAASSTAMSGGASRPMRSGAPSHCPGAARPHTLQY